MSDNVIQASFASGELSPSLFARVDITKYHSGAARMRNFFVDYRSGASTRAGTEFIRPCAGGPGRDVRLVRFQQSVNVTYALEFGDHYLRFITLGGSVVEGAIGVTNVVRGLTTHIAFDGNYNAGDLIFISEIGIREMNNRYVTVGSPATNTFFALDPFTGQDIDSTAYDPWNPAAGAGIVQRVYTIATPWDFTMLPLLKFSQRASQLNITSPFTPPYILTLISATNWTLLPAVFGATVNPPTVVNLGASASGPASYKYTVTSVDGNGQESGPAPQNHLEPVLDLRTTSGSITIVWDAVPGADSYNVYGAIPSLSGDPVPADTQFGFIGITQAPGVTFVDSNIAPDFATSPPIPNDPFVGVFANPQVSAFFQQRLVYANFGGNNTDEFIMSKPGAFYNFDFSNPSQATDEVDARLVSLEVNEIKSMIPMPVGLIMMTTKGAWQVSGGAGGVATQGGPITPTTVTATAQAYVGANDVPPILINYDILYVQQKGSIVRDLAYNIYANIFTGNDISVMSSHLFYGHQIIEWAYAEEPFKIVWAVRDDGALLSLTVVKEQDMYGWAKHDTLGNFKSICTVTEGTVDATYVVVDRPRPDGTFIKMIERIAERTFQFGAEDAWCVDAGATSGHFTPTSDLNIIIGPRGNFVGAEVSFSAASPATFGPEMVGWVIRAAGGKATVISFASDSAVLGRITLPFTDLLQDDVNPRGRPNLVLNGFWAIDQPSDTIFGLSHLEGQTVSVLADGGVIRGLTVQNTAVVLPAPVTHVTVGLGFQAQLQTMYLDLGQEANTIQGKRKKVNALTVRVKDSRGLKAGRTFSTLVPIKELNRTTLIDQNIPLITADERIIMDPLWDVPGQICLQVDDPLPCTVLGVVPEITVGDTGSGK
ncbi:MAG TPA: hypothetical protein VH187_05625 [Scandinavium sp.]|jgi:hypothetical protein|uniref:hypothetical protein n=1 Tax=Scandinavium sp. TaxID=2830653 RepID=UPI002E31416A|nr:hypothetical protein [Scandinavium sp.]HEX4500641.1 hypothetical protein [Scandinavium sp.]